MIGPDIVVCLKVVPRPEEVRVDPETLTLDRTNVRSVINPADMHALESALALKDRYGGTVRLLAMGPPLFEDYLRVTLAMGADEIYLLSDRALGGADTLATSYTLAEGIRKIGHFDLIICGEESSDGATGQVPPGVAEWLDIPQISYATDVALVDSRWRVRATRELRGGHEVLVAPLPALISIKMRSNEPRFMDMSLRDWAREAPVTVWSAEDLNADAEMIGLPGSPTVVAGTGEAAQRERRRERLAGSPAEQAEALFDRIRPYVEAALANGPAEVPPNVGSAPGAQVAGTAAGTSNGAAATGVGDDDQMTVSSIPPAGAQEARALHRAEMQRADATWEGRAELLDSDGSVIAQVLAELWKDEHDGHGPRWGGEVRTEMGGGHLPQTGEFPLRLEGGELGAVIKHTAVMAYYRNGLGGEEVGVRGSGEPPF